jgi:hypothetical protein
MGDDHEAETRRADAANRQARSSEALAAEMQARALDAESDLAELRNAYQQQAILLGRRTRQRDEARAELAALWKRWAGEQET